MVQGLAELEARWSRIPAQVREAAAEALEEVAADIVSQMRAVAPKGATKRVEGSINWTWGDAPKGSMVIGTVSAGGRKGGNEYASLKITIYAGGGDAFYARFHEFGTVKMHARPFFYPVWRARKRSAKTKVTRAITKAIRG